MLKLKFATWVAIMVATVLSFSACNNEDTYLPPNPDIVKALKQLYPNVQNIEWDQKGVYYVADCWVDGSELDVWFDANANWIMTEKDLFRENLPEAVNNALTESTYSSWVVDSITLLTYPLNDSPQYVIEVQLGDKEMALYYSQYGDLIKEKDITNADNTHWPTVSIPD